MGELRKILFPFSILYDGITSLRNTLFDIGVLKSTRFELPVIVVGNLGVGGTGKTPHIEYLIRLLKNSPKIAVLSRGYKRKSKGFLLAAEHVSVQDLGDEPFQYFSKFKKIVVAVDEDRVHGINSLLGMKTPPEIILLDDAFQHRKVHTDFNILLTTYGDLYADDFVLPAGNLRESRSGANRAKVVVVTKCPNNISISERQQISVKLNLQDEQQLFFTTIRYADEVKGNNNLIPFSELKNYEIMLITGIANPTQMLEFLDSKELNYNHISFPDHHNFSEKELKDLQLKFGKMTSKKKIILTTEKDFVRLKDQIACYFLEIQVEFLENGEIFDNTVNDYIRSSI